MKTIFVIYGVVALLAAAFFHLVLEEDGAPVSSRFAKEVSLLLLASFWPLSIVGVIASAVRQARR